MKIRVFMSSSAAVKPELTDERFSAVQRKKLVTKGTKLLITTTGSYVRKSDGKTTPQLIKNEYAIRGVEVAGNGKLKRIHILHIKDTSRASKPALMSASTLLKLLNEKATLKSKKGTKSIALK
jgi:hypothetical protein